MNPKGHIYPGEAGGVSRTFEWLSSSSVAGAVVLAVSLAITVAFWRIEVDDVERQHRLHMTEMTDRISIRLQDRVLSYEGLLHGAAGLLAALPEVDPVTWHAYFSQLGLDTLLRGAQFVAFAPVDPADGTASLSLVYPDNEENRRARSYEPFADPNQRNALVRARDTGAIALSERSTLPVESQIRVQPGFVLYLPVYRRGASTTTEEDRRRALSGYLLCALRVHDLLTEMRLDLEKDAVIDLFDGAPAPGTRLFTSRGSETPEISEDRLITVGGRAWTLRVGSSPGFDGESGSRRALLVLLGGTVFSVALGALSMLGARHQRRLLAVHHDLREAHTRYLSLVNSVPGTVFRVGPALPWRLEYISDGVVELTGKPPSYWLSADDVLRELVHPDDVDRVSKVVAWATTRGTPFEVEYRLRSEDSQPRWIAQRSRPIRAESGAMLGMSGVLSEVTHTRTLMNLLAHQRETLEEQVAARTMELLTAKDAAEAANTAKSRFLSIMSHELRTPMNAVIGYAALLSGSETDPARRKQLDRINRAGKDLLELLNRVLDFARMDAGTLDLEPAPLGVADLLDAAASRLREGLTGSGVIWAVSTAGEIPARVIGDAGRILQVLLELIDNAIEYTSTGSIRVELRARPHGENIELAFTVEDTGCGIGSGVEDHLFRPFEQGDASSTRKHGGIGLGLALARRLVILMGGSIGVDKNPGGGSRFWFTVRARATPDDSGILHWQEPEPSSDPQALPRNHTDQLGPAEREKLRTVCTEISSMLRAGELEVREVLQTHAPLLEAAFPEQTPKIVEAVESFDFDAALDSLTGGCRDAGLDLL